MNNDPELIAEGKYLSLYKKDGWEYTQRPNRMDVVGVLPITDEGLIVLVEQYRIPVGATVIEIPAGLMGDTPEHANETMEETAHRELLEETGYRANEIVPLLSTPTSAGMTTEMTHLFAATGLTREHEGGGMDDEEIVVHHVSTSELNPWLKKKQEEGYMVDYKIQAAVYLSTQRLMEELSL